MNSWLKTLPSKLRYALLSNWGWKIASIMFAIILWSYVVYNDTRSTLPRYVTFRGSEIGVVGLTDLGNRFPALALLSDSNAIVDEVRVRVDVSRANYSRVSTDNVQVELDLSRVRQKGTQEVRLTAATTYGRVVEIIPPTVTIEVEESDRRNVPITVTRIGESKDYYYNTRSTNPLSITITGPASIVRQVNEARVIFDATDRTALTSRTELITLMDADENEVSHPHIVNSYSSATVVVEIYPKRNLMVDHDLAVIGTPAPGYHVASVTIRPDYIEIWGEEALISQIDKLFIEPINVEGETQIAPRQAKIQTLPGITYMSTEVLVEVEIVEDIRETTVYDIPLFPRGKQDDLRYALSNESVDVSVTGPYSAVSGLRPEQLIALIDVTGYGAGEYDIPVEVFVVESLDLPFDFQKEALEFEASPAKVKVVIS